jgi:hypothetical protein
LKYCIFPFADILRNLNFALRLNELIHFCLLLLFGKPYCKESCLTYVFFICLSQKYLVLHPAHAVSFFIFNLNILTGTWLTLWTQMRKNGLRYDLSYVISDCNRLIISVFGVDLYFSVMLKFELFVIYDLSYYLSCLK